MHPTTHQPHPFLAFTPLLQEVSLSLLSEPLPNDIRCVTNTSRRSLVGLLVWLAGSLGVPGRGQHAPRQLAHPRLTDHIVLPHCSLAWPIGQDQLLVPVELRPYTEAQNSDAVAFANALAAAPPPSNVTVIIKCLACALSFTAGASPRLRTAERLLHLVQRGLRDPAAAAVMDRQLRELQRAADVLGAAWQLPDVRDLLMLSERWAQGRVQGVGQCGRRVGGSVYHHCRLAPLFRHLLSLAGKLAMVMLLSSVRSVDVQLNVDCWCRPGALYCIHARGSTTYLNKPCN